VVASPVAGWASLALTWLAVVLICLSPSGRSCGQSVDQEGVARRNHHFKFLDTTASSPIASSPLAPPPKIDFQALAVAESRVCRAFPASFEVVDLQGFSTLDQNDLPQTEPLFFCRIQERSFQREERSGGNGPDQFVLVHTA
jgi:hypothetical protein